MGENLLGALLARMQEKLGFACRFIPNEETLLWSKMCFLAPFALVTSASRKNKGEVLADADAESRPSAEAQAVLRGGAALVLDES